MHLAIAAGAIRRLHAAPAVVGGTPREAGVGRLMVSDIPSASSISTLPSADSKQADADALTIGAALQCTPVVR